MSYPFHFQAFSSSFFYHRRHRYFVSIDKVVPLRLPSYPSRHLENVLRRVDYSSIPLAGTLPPPIAIFQLFTRATAEIPFTPVRFPLMGESVYRRRFVPWLQENVQRLEGSFERAEEAAKDLTGKGLSRISRAKPWSPFRRLR
jgi:hypothetical protein